MKKQKIYERKTIQGADTVAGIINNRKPLVFYPETTIEHIVKEMNKHHQGAVGITEHGGAFIGIITEHDILENIFGVHGESNAAFNERQHKISVYQGELTAQNIVKQKPVCLNDDTPVEDALDIIKEYGFRFMPVIGKNKPEHLLGITSERELFWYTQEKIKRAIKQRDECLSYIMGHEPYGLCSIEQRQ